LVKTRSRIFAEDTIFLCAVEPSLGEEVSGSGSGGQERKGKEKEKKGKGRKGKERKGK